MFDKKNLAYVLTSLSANEKIIIYTENIETSQEFLSLNDQLNFNACQTLLMVIGEETKKIDDELKQRFVHIPGHLIASLRNRIAHDYRSINADISFDVIENHLGPLKLAFVDMIRLIDYPKERFVKIVNTEYYKHLRYLLED